MNDEKNWYHYTLGICLIIILAVVPIFIGAKYVDISASEMAIRSNTKVLDVFSYYKSQVICFVTLFMAFIYVVYNQAELHKKATLLNPVFVLGAVFTVLAILSTIFSPYKDIAIKGMSERYESVWILIAYMALMMISFGYCSNKFRLYFVIYAMFAGIAVIGIVGLFQYFGMDVFDTKFGAKYVLGDMYKGSPLNIKFEEVYSLLYNPNCVGMFCALTLPFTALLTIGIPAKKASDIILKIISGLLSIILIFNLIGCKSEGGLVGIIGAFAFGIFIFVVFIFVNFARKRKLQNKSNAGVYIGMIALLVFVVAGAIGVVVTNETLYNKIVENVFISSGKSVNYANTYFNDFEVDNEKNTIKILTQKGDINVYFNADDNTIQVSDFDNVVFPPEVFTKDNISTLTNDGKGKYEKQVQTSMGGTFFVRLINKDSKPVLRLKADDTSLNIGLSDDKKIYLLDKQYNIPDYTKKADKFGFEGFETFGTGRGYIWSRSIPLVLNTGLRGLFVGNGPDSFAVVFPQYEMKEKLNFLGNPYIIVDKPHNLYLQTAINTGLLSLLTLLVLFAMYIFTTIKSILKSDFKDYISVFIKLAFLLGITGYCISALTTDSIISVAPTFWIMLGSGFAVTRFSDKIFEKKN